MWFNTKSFFLAFLILFVISEALTAMPARAQEAPEDTLIVAWWNFEPFSFRQDGDLKGFGVELLEAVAKEMEVELEYMEEPVTFAGMLAAMEQGSADITAAPFFQLANREAVMDFSPSAIDSGSQIVVPLDGSGSVNLFSTVVSTGVFRFAGFGLVIILVMAHIIWLVERRQNNSDFHNSYFKGVGDGLWWASVTLSTVGYGDKVLKRNLGRFVALVWMFVGLIMMTLFVAEITATITVDRLEGGIDGLEDLRGSVVGVLAGGAFADYARDRGIEMVPYSTHAELFTGLENGEVEAIVSEVNASKYYTLTSGRRHARLAGPVFRPVEMAYGFPTNSPYREAFARALLKLKEDGRYDAIYAVWFGELR